MSEGQLLTAPYLEAGLLRNTQLTMTQRDSGLAIVASLADAGVTISPPADQETSKVTVERILAGLPKTNAASQALGPGDSRIVNLLVSSVELACRPFDKRPRDTVASKLAARWIDFVWYFGKAGPLRKAMIDRLLQLTKGCEQQPLVILAHSLGGFVA